MSEVNRIAAEMYEKLHLAKPELSPNVVLSRTHGEAARLQRDLKLSTPDDKFWNDVRSLQARVYGTTTNHAQALRFLRTGERQ